MRAQDDSGYFATPSRSQVLEALLADKKISANHTGDGNHTDLGADSRSALRFGLQTRVGDES